MSITDFGLATLIAFITGRPVRWTQFPCSVPGFPLPCSCNMSSRTLGEDPVDQRSVIGVDEQADRCDLAFGHQRRETGGLHPVSSARGLGG